MSSIQSLLEITSTIDEIFSDICSLIHRWLIIKISGGYKSSWSGWICTNEEWDTVLVDLEKVTVYSPLREMARIGVDFNDETNRS